MKCSASPTTCIAPNSLARPSDAAREKAARETAARFEALLLAKALAPVAKAIGFYGDLVVEAAMESTARRSGDTLGRALAREAERGAP